MAHREQCTQSDAISALDHMAQTTKKSYMARIVHYHTNDLQIIILFTYFEISENFVFHILCIGYITVQINHIVVASSCHYYIITWHDKQLDFG